MSWKNFYNRNKMKITLFTGVLFVLIGLVKLIFFIDADRKIQGYVTVGCFFVLALFRFTEYKEAVKKAE